MIAALGAMLTLTNCGTMAYDDGQEEIQTSSANKTARQVTFSAAAVGQVNTDDAVSRANDLSTSVKDRCSYLQYWIFDENYTKLVASGVQTSSKTTDFGSFSLTLAEGKYHVLVVGHNGSSEMTLDDKTFLLSLGKGDNRNRDTYYTNLDCDIPNDRTDTYTLTLKRNMCRVLVRSHISATNISKIVVKRNSYGTSFSVKTGYSESEQTETTYTIEVSESHRKAEIYQVSILLPLPSGEEYSDVSISLTPFDLNGKEMTTTTITDIPAMIGRNVIYDGSLWGEEVSFTVSVSDEDWEVVNKTY